MIFWCYLFARRKENQTSNTSETGNPSIAGKHHPNSNELNWVGAPTRKTKETKSLIVFDSIILEKRCNGIDSHIFGTWDCVWIFQLDTPGRCFFNKIPTTKGRHLGYFQRSGLDAGPFFGEPFQTQVLCQGWTGRFYLWPSSWSWKTGKNGTRTTGESRYPAIKKKHIFGCIPIPRFMKFPNLLKKWLKSINVKTQSLRDRPCLVLQPQPRPLHHRNLT